MATLVELTMPLLYLEAPLRSQGMASGANPEWYKFKGDGFSFTSFHSFDIENDTSDSSL
jgi:hypothetical protein